MSVRSMDGFTRLDDIAPYFTDQTAHLANEVLKK